MWLIFSSKYIDFYIKRYIEFFVKKKKKVLKNIQGKDYILETVILIKYEIGPMKENMGS